MSFHTLDRWQFRLTRQESPNACSVGEFWLEQYKHLFRWIMFSFSLPVVFYAAQDYLKSEHIIELII